MVKISGRLVEPADDKPRSGVTLILSSVKNSSVVLKHATYRCVTGGNGEYSFNAAPGTYDIAVSVYGAEPERVGQIRVYSDSLPGNLNTFLMAPAEDDLTPEIIRLVDSMRSEAVKAAESAKQSEQVTSTLASDVATHAEQVASNKVVVEQKTTIVTDAAATAVAAKDQTAKDAAVTGQNRQVTETKAREAAASADEAKSARDSIVNDAADVRAKAKQVADNEVSVANNTAAVQRNTEQVAQNTQTVGTKAQQVAENTNSVSANTLSVTQMRDEVVAKTSMAQAAADTATQKAASAAEHDASSAANAKIAQDAASAVQGVLIDGGECDLSSGVYPPPQTVAGKNYSTVWYVKTGGVVSGITYDSGDVLRYTTAKGGYYFRVDAVDTTTTQINAHATKDGAHQIGGVAGLAEALADKASVQELSSAVADKATKEEVSIEINAHKAESNAHTPQNVGADPAGTAASAVSDHVAASNPHPQYSDFLCGEERDFATRKQLAKRAAEYHPMDGQLVPRATDQGLLAAILAGEVPSCSESDWLANPENRGCYTLGDGSTTIRIADLNGKSLGSLGAPVIRGDGLNAASAGKIQGDCIRNFKGSLSLHGGERPSIIGGMSGVLAPSREHIGAYRSAVDLPQINSPAVNSYGGFDIDASRFVPTGPENRMVNTAKVRAVKR